jgi:hypothetical protein
MKAVICLLALAGLVAVIADPVTDVTLQVGYGVKAELDKNGGIAHYKINVPKDAYPTANLAQMRFFLRFYVTSEASSAGGAVVKYWVGKTNAVVATDPVLKTKTASQGYGAVDFEIPGTPYYNVNQTDTDYILTVQSSECSTCISTVEIKVGVWFVWKKYVVPADGDPAGDAKVQGFQIKEESYTLPFTLADGAYGGAGWFDVTDKNIFVRVDTSLSNKAVVVFTKGAAALPTQNPIDNYQETATFKRFPADDPKFGAFRTGGKLLDAGRWYFQVFSVKAGSAPALVQFALGNGHEPAAAGMVVPSFAILAVAIVSLLAHLL